MKRRDMAWIARAIAQKMLVRQRGDMDDPNTWADVAVSFGCILLPFCVPGGELGDYRPALDSEGRGVIRYNTAVTPPAQARIIAHECGHHLLWWFITADMFTLTERERYETEPSDVRHEIAKQSESLCFRRIR